MFPVTPRVTERHIFLQVPVSTQAASTSLLSFRCQTSEWKLVMCHSHHQHHQPGGWPITSPHLQFILVPVILVFTWIDPAHYSVAQWRTSPTRSYMSFPFSSSSLSATKMDHEMFGFLQQQEKTSLPPRPGLKKVNPAEGTR